MSIERYTLFALLACSCALGAQSTEPRVSVGPSAGTIAPSPANLLAAHRRAALAKLVAGPRSPLDEQRLYGVRFFPYAPAFSFTALFRAPTDSVRVDFPTSDGRTRAYVPYGQLIFFYAGAAHALTIYEMPGLRTHALYGDLLFLPFFDESNGARSYGGGRYVDLSRAALDSGDYRLDFNLAYNPWCAYADDYSCPVPPPENTLPFPVHAGEAAFVLPEPTKPDAPAERGLPPRPSPPETKSTVPHGTKSY